MGSPFYWLRYLCAKVGDSVSSSLKPYKHGQISGRELQDRLWKNIFQERMTFSRVIKGETMEPTFSAQGESLLIRKIPSPSSRSIFVGDVVLFKDPWDLETEHVRRVAAIEGDEMVSTDRDDIPFELEEGFCWVVCDNNAINPTKAGDSRSFGPLSMENIIGRVIYSRRSAVDHGHVKNSDEANKMDSPVLAVELDVDELSKM